MCAHDTPRYIDDCLRSEWTKLSHIASVGIPEFESIGICRKFVRKTVLDAMCVRALDTKERNKEIKKSYLTMDDGAKAAAEAVKAMMPARENFILVFQIWCFKVAMRNARKRSEQMRMLANARNKLEDGGANHARRKGGMANFGVTPN